MQAFKVTASCEPAEVKVLGSWAYVRNHIRVAMTPRIGGGSETRRAGYALSILKKKDNGAWVVTRDANLMIPEP
jgi:ketosteroid isomerase-like protein